MQTVGRIFIDAHRSAWTLLLRQSGAVLIMAIGILVDSLGQNLINGLIASAVAQMLFDWALHAAIIWVTAPAVVSIFRALILDDATDPHPLHRSVEIDAYFKAAVAISVLTLIPPLFSLVLNSGTHTGFAALAPSIGPTVAIWYLLTRLTTYLPGIAVGRSGNSIGLALREAQGRFALIASTYIVALAPAFLVALGLALLFHGRAPWQISILLFIPSAILLLISTCVSALLYRELKREVQFDQSELDPLVPARTTATAAGPRRTFGRMSHQSGTPATVAAAPFVMPSQITVAGIARAAYGDLVNIVRQMWPVLLILTALYFVCAMSWFIAPIFVNAWVGRMVMRMLIFIGIAWVATPYYVALHRFVSTGEVQWIPPREAYGRASMVYFGWSGLTVALWFLPLILGNTADAFSPSLAVLTELAMMILVFVVLVRMTTLLPAAALAPDRAGWAQAMDDSRGRFRLFAFSTAGAVLPAIVVLFIIGRAAGSQTISALPFFALAVPALLVMQLVPLAAGTRLYEQLPRETAIPRMQQVIRPR